LPEFTKIIKTTFSNSKYYVLFKETVISSLSIYDVNNKTCQDYALGNGTYTDFDILDNEHILLVE